MHGEGHLVINLYDEDSEDKNKKIDWVDIKFKRKIVLKYIQFEWYHPGWHKVPENEEQKVQDEEALYKDKMKANNVVNQEQQD